MVEYPIVVYQERKWKIYVYTNIINQKKYVGQTSQTLKRRAGKNGNSYQGCLHFCNAINMYGWENFMPIIVNDNLTHREANILEQIYIIALNTRNKKYGYNIANGGKSNDYQAINISGQRFGRLTAIRLHHTSKTGRYWFCKCDCGRTTIVRQDHLRNGTTSACIKCGCKTKHIIPNDYEISGDIVTVFMHNEKTMILDLDDYEKIKNFRWLYDPHANRIVCTSTGKNILSFLFPHIKRKNGSRLITFLDGNVFNLRRNNLYEFKPLNVDDTTWNRYLSDENSIVYFIKNNKNKKWKNTANGKTYINYDDALKGV